MPKIFIPTRNPSFQLSIKTDDPIPDNIVLRFLHNCEPVFGRVRVRLVDQDHKPIAVTGHVLRSHVKAYQRDHEFDVGILDRNICVALTSWRFVRDCTPNSDSDSN